MLLFKHSFSITCHLLIITLIFIKSDIKKTCKMLHLQVFWATQACTITVHQMPPSGECLCHIAQVAAMVDEFVVKHKNTNKNPLLASNLQYNQPLVVYENFVPKTRPLLSLSMQQALCKCEKQRKCSRTFLAIKHCNRT